MNLKKVCLLGGTGFVGRRLTYTLIQKGYHVRILTRHPQRHRDLTFREVDLQQADIHDPSQLREQLQGMDAVVNLIGILNEEGHDGKGFSRAHVDLPRALVTASTEIGLKRILHMSALKAGEPKAQSHYLETKGAGEDLIHTARATGLIVTSFRPSVIFGPKDHFLNRFALMLRLAPVLPLACAEAQLAPVFIDDVVAVMIAALSDSSSHNQRYDLCGPKIYTLQQIVEYVAQLLGLRRVILPLNKAISRGMAQSMEWIPGKPFSIDNFLSLQTPSICSENYLFPFKISPTPMEAVAPSYLNHQHQRACYPRFRAQAGR